CDAAERPSRFRAPETARERALDGLELRDLCPFRRSRSACARVRLVVFPRLGGGSFTPARRAFESPIAIACWGDRAPCFPSRICSISSRTNSPACVLADLPCLLSRSARSITSSSGMFSPPSDSKTPMAARTETQSLMETACAYLQAVVVPAPVEWGFCVIREKSGCRYGFEAHRGIRVRIERLPDGEVAPNSGRYGSWQKRRLQRRKKQAAARRPLEKIGQQRSRS